MTDGIDSTHFKIADLTGAGDMLLKGEILVEGNVQVADGFLYLKKDKSRFHSDRQRKGETGFSDCV